MKLFFSRLKTRLNYLLYNGFLFRFGFGNRVSKNIWEQQYDNGTWDYLFSEEEAAHYFSICSQIKKHAQSLSILDIGCGNGVLYDYLFKNINDRLLYSGIDISENAVCIAKGKFKDAAFNKVDYDYENVNGKYDVLVFNETLYYFTRPMKTLAKAIGENLNAGGIIVISMCEDEKHNYIWDKISAEYFVLDEERVENRKGQKWTIKTISSVKSEMN